MNPVLVIGGGVAGASAACAIAAAGREVLLVERSRTLGGVAVSGDHRTLCGLAPLDAAEPVLIEPELTRAWVEVLAIGAPQHRGRTWLWPTEPAAFAAGLARRLSEHRIATSSGATVTGIEQDNGRIRTVAIDGRPQTVAAVIDASGGRAVADLLGLPADDGRQWGAWRAVLRVSLAHGVAARVRALGVIQRAIGGTAACDLVELGDDQWQLSIDLPPGAAPATAAATAAAAALGGELVGGAVAVAERDAGGYHGELNLDQLLATRERGLCWAAWPGEEHGADGVRWTWPDADRYGVPSSVVRPTTGPTNLRVVGKGLPVSRAAAAALRVTGTALALAAALGARVEEFADG